MGLSRNRPWYVGQRLVTEAFSQDVVCWSGTATLGGFESWHNAFCCGSAARIREGGNAHSHAAWSNQHNAANFSSSKKHPSTESQHENADGTSGMGTHENNVFK